MSLGRIGDGEDFDKGHRAFYFREPHAASLKCGASDKLAAMQRESCAEAEAGGRGGAGEGEGERISLRKGLCRPGNC